LTFRPNRRLELGIDGGQEKRNGSGDIYDYSSGYVGVRGRLTL
jgi:hypothetical protein